MRELLEIISNTKVTDYTGSSSAVLDICKELAVDGRFEEIADVLAEWCKQAPNAEKFIRARLPSIVLNCYFVKNNILTYDQFSLWEETASDWTSVKNCALSRTKLPSAVAAMESQLRQFGKIE